MKNDTANTLNTDAIDTPDVLSLNVPPDDYFQNEWRATDLPHGMARRMADLEEAVSGLDGVDTLLRIDAKHRASRDSHGSDVIEYVQLNNNILFKLYSAQRVLIDQVSSVLESAKISAAAGNIGRHHSEVSHANQN